MNRNVVFFFAVVGIIITAGADIRWQDQSRMFRRSRISDVVWTGERYVAVGSIILTSTDGMAWRLGDGVSEKHLEWVVWTGNQFIAFGGGWRADWLTSPDGLTWTNHVFAGRYLYHSVWTRTKIVATGDSGTIITSEDLTKWTKQDVPASARFTNVIWTGTQIVAVGDSGTIVTSEDCTKWTKQVSNTTRKLYNVVSTGTQLVAVGDSGTVLTSADGAVWTIRSVPTTNAITNILWTGAMLVATNKNSKALTSQDGIVWKLDESVPRIQRIVRGDACIYGMRIGYDSVYTSTDSLNWNPLSLPEGTSDLYGLAYGNGRLIMVGDTLTVIGSDTAGKSTLYWKGGISRLNRINRTKKGYAAVGDEGIVITSRDGFAWRRYSVPTTYNLSFITATDSLYIVGCSGNIFTSPDCITWTEKKFNATSLNDAAMNDSLVVIIGYYGRIYTTRDGVNWTGRTSKTIDELKCIIWTGSGFMVGTGPTYTYGASDCFLTSPDGITWTNHTRKPQGSINDIAWSGSTLVGVGGSRTFLTSDFSEWKWSNGSRTLNTVKWTGREFVAAGSSDSIYTSVDGNAWITHDMGRFYNVKSLLWADSMFFAAGERNDDSASLLIGMFDGTPVRALRRNATIRNVNRNRPILYTGTFSSRIAEGRWLYGLDGRRIVFIHPAGRDGRQTPMRGIPNGIWILKQK